MTTTTIAYNNGKIVTRVGTSGLTLTSARVGESVDVLMEFDFVTREECAAMVGSLLVQLEQLSGENLVAQCIAHYAQQTDKVIRRQGKRDLVWIRGHKDRRR